MKRKLMQLYVWLAALLVRAVVAYCTKRRRYVDYVHTEAYGPPPLESGRSGYRERVYMRRYVITGFMTGDPHPNTLLSLRHCGLLRFWFGRLRRWFALNRWHLYLHHMHAPDADSCLHDHPWPWGVSWVLLGGYREERADPQESALAKWWGMPHDGLITRLRWLQAPALNLLRGTTFHRISELAEGDGHGCGTRGPLRALATPGPHRGYGCCGSCTGTWTLFLAGPRRASKPWGYLVPGRGFVPQRERHAEMGASERRAEAPLAPTGKALKPCRNCKCETMHLADCAIERRAGQ